MLNQETQDKLSKVGLDVSKLSEAIKAEEEISLDVPNLYTEDQKNSFGSNRFTEGKQAMSEIKAKEYKSTFGIDIEGKDIDKVVNHIIDLKVSEAGGKPNEKVDQYKTQITELQGKLQNKTQEIESLQSDFQGKLLINEVNSVLSNSTPDKIKIPKQDLITLFNSKYSVRSEEGKQIVLKDGEVLKDDLLNPIPLKDVYTQFLSEGKYIEKNGMNGDDYEGGSSATFKDMDQFMKYCEKNNIEPMSDAGQKLLAEKKAKDFKY